MRKLILLGVGAATGATLAYLLDPDRGRSRRARLADQTAARGRDIAESAKQTFEYQKGVARGMAHDIAGRFEPETTYDDETLGQKVRSEVLGHWEGNQVEVDIHDGMVVVAGKVEDQAEHDRLLHLIQEVKGVTIIDDRLKVGVA